MNSNPQGAKERVLQHEAGCPCYDPQETDLSQMCGRDCPSCPCSRLPTSGAPIAPPVAPEGQDGWISVEQQLPPLDADNCCMEDDERGRYSDPVLVFDEGEAQVLRAIYDGKKSKWSDASDGCELHDVTDWRPLPAPPERNTHDR